MTDMEGGIDLAPGTRLAHGSTTYVIDETLGSGGFGITYRATDLRLERAVAIKEYFPLDFAGRGRNSTIVPGKGDEEELFEWGRTRFVQEARLLARFEHPAILGVLDYFEANGTAYMVLPLIPGGTLDARWHRARLTEAEARAMLARLIPGLRLLHDAGVLHRDIKPGNIMLPQGDPAQAVLIDFGAARRDIGSQSRSLAALVSPPYSPREQYATSLPEGPATDVYALAATIYRAMLGAGPPEAIARDDDDNLPQLDRAVAEGAVSLPMALMFRHALAPRLEARIASMAALETLLAADAPPKTAQSEGRHDPRTTENRAAPPNKSAPAPADLPPWWKMKEPLPVGTYPPRPALDWFVRHILRAEPSQTPTPQIILIILLMIPASIGAMVGVGAVLMDLLGILDVRR